MEKNKRIISILSIFTIIFTLMGGTLAYWTWTSDTRTGVAFTIDKDFSCSADGGGNISPTNISLEPSTCDNTNSAIKREIKVTPDIKKDGIEISMDLWLNINNIDTPLSDSYNLRYVLTTSEDSCSDEGVISSGTFNGKKNGDKVVLMEKNYTADANETYYLYIWLDKFESNSNTMNQTFDFSLGGVCSNYLGEPEAPVLDDGMIPVTIADDGTVTMVSETDPNWYNYENKQWANIVLVEEEATADVENSHPRSYYQDTANVGEEVTQEDILAYYVWIPRYKYRVPTKKCSEIENPNMNDYPECYAPYSLSEEEQRYLEKYLYEYLDEELRVIKMAEGDIYVAYGYYSLPYLVEKYQQSFINGELSSGYGNITLEFAGFNGNNVITPKEGVIDIVFESTDEVIKLGNATSQYRTHPAFWWNHDNDGIVDDGELIPGIWVGKYNSNAEKNSACYTTPDSTNCNNSTQNPTILPSVEDLKLQSISNQFYTSRNISKEGNIYGLNHNLVNAHMMKNSEWGAIAYLIYSNYGINQAINDNVSTTGNNSGVFDMNVDTNVMAMSNSALECDEGGYGPGDCSEFEEYPARKYIDYFEDSENVQADATCDIYCAGHGLYEFRVKDNDYMFVYRFDPWLTRSISSDSFYYYPHVGNLNYSWRSVLVSGFGD